MGYVDSTALSGNFFFKNNLIPPQRLDFCWIDDVFHGNHSDDYLSGDREFVSYDKCLYIITKSFMRFLIFFLNFNCI